MLIFLSVVQRSVNEKLQNEIEIATSTNNWTWFWSIIISFNQATLGMVVGDIWSGNSVVVGSYRNALCIGDKRVSPLGLD